MRHFQIGRAFRVVVLLLIGFAATAPTGPDAVAQSGRDAAAEAPGPWPRFPPPEFSFFGIDATGGTLLLLEVDARGAIAARYSALRDEIAQALRDAGVGRFRVETYEARGLPEAIVTVLDPADFEAAGRALRGLAAPVESRMFAEEILDLSVTPYGDGESYRLSVDAAAREAMARIATDRTAESLRMRLDALGHDRAAILRRGDDSIELQSPGVLEADLDALLRPAVLTFHVVADEGVDLDGPTMLLEYDAELSPDYAGRTERVFERVELSGDRLIEASSGFDGYGGVGVNIRFDAEGARIFRRLSEEHLDRRFAVVLDGRIVSAPLFRTPIPDGRAIITGSFTVETAEALAAGLRAGGLPADVRVLERVVIEPRLSADTVAAGQAATVVGVVSVLIWMGIS